MLNKETYRYNADVRAWLSRCGFKQRQKLGCQQEMANMATYTR